VSLLFFFLKDEFLSAFSIVEDVVQAVVRVYLLEHRSDFDIQVCASLGLTPIAVASISL
jgi:hypothetical protein